ncbi:MAG: hypothetical protein M3512_13255 [Bacteroidota bacterium]|nr:hypothetical protein [Bacteroidota bacterium]
MIPILVIFSQLKSFSQFEETYEDSRRFHLGFTTGINNISGILGPNVEYKLEGPISLYGAAGLGTWGFKLSGGARYYFDYPNRFALNLGLSHALGANKIETEIETVSSGSGNTQKVTMDLHPTSTLNISTLYFIKMGKHSRFNFEFGYAVPLKNRAYSIHNGAILTETSHRVMKLLQPGGLILGIGVSFGL